MHLRRCTSVRPWVGRARQERPLAQDGTVTKVSSARRITHAPGTCPSSLCHDACGKWVAANRGHKRGFQASSKAPDLYQTSVGLLAAADFRRPQVSLKLRVWLFARPNLVVAISKYLWTDSEVAVRRRGTSERRTRAPTNNGTRVGEGENMECVCWLFACLI